MILVIVIITETFRFCINASIENLFLYNFYSYDLNRDKEGSLTKNAFLHTEF